MRDIIPIVEKLKKEKRKELDNSPFLELPLPQPMEPREKKEEPKEERGVVVIKLW